MVKTREPECELIDSTRIWWIQPSLQESGDYVERVKSTDGYKYFLCVREDSPLVDRQEITRLTAFSYIRGKNILDRDHRIKKLRETI